MRPGAHDQLIQFLNTNFNSYTQVAQIITTSLEAELNNVQDFY